MCCLNVIPNETCYLSPFVIPTGVPTSRDVVEGSIKTDSSTPFHSARNDNERILQARNDMGYPPCTRKYRTAPVTTSQQLPPDEQAGEISRHKAFTLIELLVVLAVIALLAGMLMPSLVAARQIGKRLVCLSNLRQMVIAANGYLADYNEYYPLASFVDKSQAAEGVQKNCEWDFCKVYEFGQMTECKPGLLWQGDTNLKIQQCPAFKGGANSPGDQFTGYNYNVSFIGGILERAEDGTLAGTNSIRSFEVKRPAGCVIFGDGQYLDGANKFMRSPWLGKLETNDDLKLKPYGTQGFRHLGKTNVAYCDGRAETLADRYTQTHEELIDLVAEYTGFLSPDNSAYDLK